MRITMDGTSSSYVLVRIVFLRALAFVYTVAFTIALRQNKALIGDRGLTPARKILDQAQARDEASRQERSKRQNEHDKSDVANQITETIRYIFLWDRRDVAGHPVTTILWLVKDRSKLNSWLDGIGLVGIVISLSVLILGRANVPLLGILFLCQRSLLAVGGEWYAYGWEPLLAELGFHAIFLVPLWELSTISMVTTRVPEIVVWCIRWFLFRAMMGAGLIKLKGSKCWWELTAMNFFYETQPVPNFLSKYFHFAPQWWHRIEVLGNHFVELVAPWLVLVPVFRSCRIAGGVIQIMFQAILILGGSLSFLNWLTAIPAIFCFDDNFIRPLFSKKMIEMATIHGHVVDQGSIGRQVVSIVFGLLIVALSVPIIRNFFSSEQIMIGSFDTYQILNVFGAFGSIAEERVELIISSAIDAEDGEWKEYEFPVKPGNPLRRPRWISPYHYRLDWQLWIASQFGNIYASPWMYRLLIKLLEADPVVLQSLLAHDPWNGQAPKLIKVERYRYKFHRHNDGKYWDRELLGRFYPRQGKGATLETLWRQSDRVGF